MVKAPWSLFAVILVLVMSVAGPTLATPQRGSNFPTPPEPLDSKSSDKGPTTATRHIDFDRLQREADDLVRNAQGIPSDVASIRKGMLPKDVIEKLKQIEKLSKHMRSELNP